MMAELSRERSALKVLLIGGSSHAGKSTVTESLAEGMGWSRISTDSMARHPGRPWKAPPQQVPDRVAEHYLSLSVDDLLKDVLRHYRANVWPLVEDIIAERLADAAAGPLIIEGSALWPELVAGLECDHTAAVWLTASREIFRYRIYRASRYATRPSRDTKMIDKFLRRTLRYDRQMMEPVRRLGLSSVTARAADSVSHLAEKCLHALKDQHSRVSRSSPQRRES